MHTRMEEDRNIKWVLIISLIMLLSSALVGAVSFYSYYPPREPSGLEMVAFYINRIDILLFIVTIATSTLYTAGFKNKELMFKTSIYLFIISMALFLISILKWLFTYP